jgi:3-oxoacyl-[acyl-carrier protein] reductase
VCIAPETILTEENRRRIPDGLQDDLARQHPVPRLGTPEDVAHAVRFLASDGAGWISGVTLDIAGGAVLA